MGRPIKKSFFANLNAPYQDQATGGPTGYGGEGVASYGTIVAGTGWTTAPTVTVSDPDFSFDGATKATVQAHYKALSIAVTANGSGYDFGNTIQLATGTAGTAARATVSEVVVTNVTMVDNGQDYEAGNTITMSGAGWSQPLIITVDTADGGGNILTFTVTQAGRRTAAVPANPVGGVTATGTGLDSNGINATFNLTWGVYSLSAPTVAGDYTVFPSVGGATTAITGAGVGLQVTATMGLLSVAVLTPGRGYTSTTDAAISFSGATGAAATAVLTSSYDNGLKAYAFVAGGSAGLLSDIMKQEASRRYLVKNSEGQSQCKLVAVATGGLSEGEMNLTATDTLGSTYFVTKLTARRATLTQDTDGGGGFEFADGAVAGWTIGSPDTGIVSLANV